MIVEPKAGDRVEDNLNPVGRAYYGFSTLLCTPASLSQEVGLALGAQAGPARIRDVVSAGRVHPLPHGRGDAVQPGVRSATMTAMTDRPEQTRALRPDGRGIRRSRRRPDLLRGLRRRRAGRAPDAALGDRALADLEGADPLPRPPRHRVVASTRAATAAPTVRSRRPRTTRRSTPTTPWRCSTRPAWSGRSWSSLSLGAQRALIMAGRHPEPGCGRACSSARTCRSQGRRPGDPCTRSRTSSTPTRAGRSTTATTGCATGPDIVEFFFSQMFNEPHSTKQIEDGVGWGLETDAETILRGIDAAFLSADETRALCARFPRAGAGRAGRPGHDLGGRRRCRAGATRSRARS